MKLFQSVQENFAVIGVTLDQSMKINPFNERILAALLSYTLNVASYIVFLFHDATTFLEYTYNIYANSATILILICYIIVIFKMKKCFALIDGCANIVAEGKLMQIVLSITWVILMKGYTKRTTCFRSWRFRIESIIRQNQSRNRKIQWNHIFNDGKSDYRVDGVSKIYWLPHRIFYFKFRQRRLGAPTSNVVGIHIQLKLD